MNTLSSRNIKKKSKAGLTRKRRGRANYRAFLETLEPRRLMSVVTALPQSGVGGGGWFAPAAINPNNSSEIFMGTDEGQLFHTTNGGASWTYPSLSQISQSYYSPVQFTSLSNGSAGPLWAVNHDGTAPAISTDGGNTWTDNSAWSVPTQGNAAFVYADPTSGSSFIVASGDIVGNSSIESQLFLSTNGGTSWGSSLLTYTGPDNVGGYAEALIVSGMFKSGPNIWISTSQGILYSSNTGASFTTLTLPQSSSVEDPYSMAVAQSGTTIRFVIVTDNPNAFTYNTNFNGGYLDATGAGHNGFMHVYTSDFNTTTQTQGAWTNITSDVPANDYPSFAAMAAGNITTIYLGGSNNSPGYGVPSVLKTTTGGSTWSFTETFLTTNNANIATNHVGAGYEYDYGFAGSAFSLQVDSANVNDVIITDNFTAWMTTDGGTGGANTTVANADWKDITVAPAYLHAPNTVGTPGTTAYAGSADNTAVYNMTFLSPTNVFASMTDNTGVYSTDGGNSWYYPTFNSGAYFGNFFNVTADYSTDVLFASAGRQNDLYQNYRLQNSYRDEQPGGVDYSTDGGKTWNLLKQFTNTDGTTNPVAEFVIDPNVAGTAYALVANSTNGGIYVTHNLYLADGKTVNTAATWTELTAPSRTLSAFNYGYGAGINYAAGTYTAHDPNQLTVLSNGTLVATYDATMDSTDDITNDTYLIPTSGIWVSTNGGTTWTDRSDLNLTQSSMMFYTQHLTLDPTDSTQQTWYASVDENLALDYGEGNVGVFKTTNGGVSWTQLFSPGDGNQGAENVAINPDTTSTDMYVASQQDGLFYSSTKLAGSFTAVSAENFGDITSVAFNPYRTSQVWVTTHGSGMQKGDNTTPTPSNLTAVGNDGSQVTLNWTAVSGADSYLVEYTTGAVNWQGAVTWTQYGSPLGTGSTSVNINSLAANLYYFRIVPKTGGTIDGYSNIVAGPVLAAPTNVVATSDSPNEVDVSWQYSGSGLGAQFQVQRSTDSSTWTVIGTTASTSVLTYADTTAAANTFYYYRIVVIAAATFSSLPSNYSSAKTLATGGLIVYDGFDYAARSSLNNQGAAGNNWAGAWTTTGGGSAITGAGLTPPGNLAGNSGSVGGPQTLAVRNTSAALDTYGSTIWASALIKADTSSDGYFGSVTVGNVVVMYHDYTANGNFGWTIESNNNSWWGTTFGGTSSPPVTNGATDYLVVEITYNAGNDSVRVWLNPTPGSTAPSNSAEFDYVTGVNAGGTLTEIQLNSQYHANSQFDEVRVGTSYASVAPTVLPTAPAGLSATTVSTSQINLTWTNQTLNTSGYNIYSSTNGTTFTYLGASTSASYSATSLAAGTTYYFQVTAYNASSNESGYSNRASATTTASSGLIASDSFSYSTGGLNGDGSAGSGWAGAWSTNNSSITVSSTSLTPTVNLATSGGSASIGETGGTATRTLSSSLNSNGSTLWASALVTPDTTTTSNWGNFVIGNVVIQYNRSGGGVFEWTILGNNNTWWGTTWNTGDYPATGGTAYFLVAEITYNSGSDSVRVWLNPATGSTAPSTSTEFDYKSGVNAGGTLSTVQFESNYYSDMQFDEVRLGTTYGSVAPVGVTIPAAPSGLSATTASQTQINLAWTDNATNETGFKVYQSTNGTSFTLLQTINTPNTTSYNVTGLSPQIEYWYKVTAFNTGGESSYSNTANATTLVNGLIASDNFAYATGGLNGDGSAGDGWAGAWSTNNSSIVASTAGLSSTVNLATSGGSASIGETSGTATRTLSSSLNSNGSTLWASALVTPDTTTTSNWGNFVIGNVIIQYNRSGGGVFEWTILGNDGTWYGTTWNSGDYPATSGTTYLLVAEIVYSGGSDSVRVWLNPAAGSTQPTDASSFDYKTGVNAGGTLSTVQFESNYYSDMQFDEVRLGTTYASVAPANLPASLVGLWRLDEGTGSTANDTDTDGVSDTGTVTGSPTWVAGKIGDALSLNGTSQYVQVANSTDLNISGSGFSTAMWVKSAASTWNSTETFISKGNGYEFGGVSGSKNIEFSLYIGGAWKNLTYTNTGDISTSWHDYAATYDGSNMRIWIDGTNVATLAQTGTIGSNTSVLYIGRNGSTYLGGSIDEVRVYNAALNSTNVSALYNQTALSITGLTVDSANASSYSVQNYGLETGVSQYGDTTKNFTTIPSKYLGSTFIRTAEADSTSTTANLLTFTVNQPVIVYVLFDDAITTKPAWLTSQFTDTGDNIVSAEGTFSVYKMTVSAGTFTLGGPGGTGTQGMYSVMFQSVL